MFKPLSRWVAVCAFKEFGAFDGAIEIIFDNWTWYVGQRGWTVSLEKCLNQKYPFVEVAKEPDGSIAQDYFDQYETKGPKKLHSKELADWSTISRLGLSTQIGELRYAMAFQPKQLFDFNQTQKVIFEPSTGWTLLGYYSGYIDENVFSEEWLFNRGDDYITAHQQEIQVDWETTTSWGLAALTRKQAADWLIENNIANSEDVVSQSSYLRLDQVIANAPVSVDLQSGETTLEQVAATKRQADDNPSDNAEDKSGATGDEEIRMLIKRVTKDGTNEQLNALRILGGCNRYFDFVGVAFPGEDGTEQNRRWNAFRTSLNRKLNKAGWQLERDVNDVGYVKNAIKGEVRNK